MARQPTPNLRAYSDEVTGTLAPSFDWVPWSVACIGDDDLLVTYAGSPADLVAAGCATPAMLVPYRRGARAPCDEVGDAVRREFRGGWVRLGRYKSVARALRLPGITLEAIRRAKALLAETRPWMSQPDLSAYDRPRPQLRLVVDNTRPTYVELEEVAP